MVTKELKGFDEKLNGELRNMYIQSLNRPVQYEGDKGPRPRVRHVKLWEAIPPEDHTVDIFNMVKNPGQNIWVWSDLHFGHNNIIKFSDRPYRDTVEMDEELIDNFNRLVGPDDVSIWVGDVSFRGYTETAKILYRLPGYKILIAGNHDMEKKKGVRKMPFDEVHIVYNLQIGETKVAFTHYPMDNLPIDWVNVHGHIHKNKHFNEVETTTHINVNCEFQDYRPIPFQQIINQVEVFADLNKSNKSKVKQIDYTEYD